MKRCSFCGKEYPDSVAVCPTDRIALDDVVAGQIAKPAPDDEPEAPQISRAEERFWSRMTFRQFAVLILRIQALWFLFGAVVDSTYLPGYFRRSTEYAPTSSLYSPMKFDLFLAVLRVILHVAAALALLQNSERILSWLVKDNVEAEATKNENRTS